MLRPPRRRTGVSGLWLGSALVTGGCNRDVPLEQQANDLVMFSVDLADAAGPDLTPLPPDMTRPPGPTPVLELQGIKMPTTLQPMAVVTGDFNNDGRSDVAVAGAEIAVHKAFADGSLSFGAKYSLGAGADALAVGDVNGNAQLDIVYVDQRGQSINTLFGDGMGMFSTAHTQKVQFVPQTIAVADVDLDGKLDAVIGNVPVGQLGMPGYTAVLLGDAMGNWSVSANLRTGQRTDAVGIADLNKDKWPDVVVVDRTYGWLNVMIASGHGAFKDPVQQSVVGSPASVAIADFNGDTFPDMALALADGGAGIFVNHGDGTFAPPGRVQTGGLPISIAAADFNHDGHLDLALASRDGQLTLLSGAGDATFVAAITVRVPAAAISSMAVGDFNNDKRPDVVLADLNISYLSVLLNRTP